MLPDGPRPDTAPEHEPEPEPAAPGHDGSTIGPTQSDRPPVSSADAAVETEPPPRGHDEPVAEVEGEGVESTDPGPPMHVADPARRRALLPWLIAAGTVLVLGSIAFGLTYTPLFRADEIRVDGEAHLSEAKILKIAGLGPGTNLLHADLAGAQLRLERQPWIARVTITRSLPHTLDINVVERVPVAITVAGGHRVLVSVQGVPLGGAGSTHAFPAVTSPEGTADLAPSALRTGAEAAAAMPPGLRAEIGSITVDGDGAIVMRTGNGILVTYGDDTQLEAKAQSLKAVLAWAVREGKALATVDVTVPGAPTARLDGGVTVAR